MIRELKQKGWTISAIARETGFDRKTIRKHLEADQAPQSKKRGKRESKLDPYKPYLMERIKEGTTNCSVLMEEIQAKGYEGKSTILREFVQPFREAPIKSYLCITQFRHENRYLCITQFRHNSNQPPGHSIRRLVYL